MPKQKESKTVDTKELSAMTTEVDKKSTPAAVDNSDVSPKKKKSEKPKVISLDDLDAFDPSATHEDLSEDDVFDDEDESY